MKFQRIYLPLTTFFCVRKLLQHRFTILQIFCFSFFVFFIQRPVQAQQRQPFAQGNLFVVFNPKTGRSSDQSPQLAYLNALWCQATQNGNDRLQIKEAHFVHVEHKEGHKHPARLDNAMKRAYLDLGQAQISEIGKYRCEITTEANQSISGNLFVYMRPLFNTTMRLVQAEEGNNFAWVAPLLKVTVGEQANIECPAIGYPSPQIRWFKTGVPINTTATVSSSNQKKYLLGAQSLMIRAMEADDAGIYECKSTNSFPLNVDQDPREFHLSLMQELVVTKSHSWLIPLFVILICIILLVLIIWGCSAWKQYKRKQYNVAQKEKEFGQKGVDGQRLPLESEDVEE